MRWEAWNDGIMTLEHRAFWLSIRQALIIMLGAIEDLLEMERSITPKHKR